MEAEIEHRGKRRRILEQMAQIECMEKGRLSEEYREKHIDGKRVPRPVLQKHQCWENGRNASRRVPAVEMERPREGVNGYHPFRELADEFVEVTVSMSRESADDEGKKKPG
ncbi:MAG: hypothetical protein V3V05_08455 [Pontiella sp.]